MNIWMLMIFLNGNIFKYGKYYFPLKGLDYSHCLSAWCSLSSRLWLLGLYPKGTPATDPISGTHSKMCVLSWMYYQAGGDFHHAFVPTSHTAKRCCISPCPAGIQAQPCWASLSDSTQTHSFPTPLEAQSLFLNFITWQISRTFHFTQSNRKRRSLNWIPRTMSHVPQTMTHILLFDSQHDWGIMWSRAASLFLHWPATAESVTQEVTQSFNNYNSLVLCATLSAYKGKYGQ